MTRIALVLALMAAPAFAQDSAATVTPCGDATRADTIAEPWEDNTATYADDQVRIAMLDMVEPAGGALKLLVISPPRNELGLRQCRVVGLDNGLGFYDMNFAAHQASYDPARGLTITLPARHYPVNGDFDGDEGWFQLSVIINQQTGDIVTQWFK
jgi:hypothetical protein